MSKQSWELVAPIGKVSLALFRPITPCGMANLPFAEHIFVIRLHVIVFSLMKSSPTLAEHPSGL